MLCSSAARARQTLDLLKLDDQLDPDRVEIADRFYNAGADTLINAVRELPEVCHVALLVGHAPGAPGVVYELTDQATSTPEAVSAIEGRFPAAALAQLDFEGDWSASRDRLARLCPDARSDQKLITEVDHRCGVGLIIASGVVPS